MVGREDELALAQRLLDEARAGRGATWLITGEAGIGKTRLLEAVAATARDAFRVAWGRAWEEGGAPSHWPWREVFRALGRAWEEPPAGPPGPEARFAHHERLTAALAELARHRPLLVLLDDVHAADEASLALTALAAQRLATAPVLLVATARDADPADREAIARLARAARCTALRRLSRGEVSALVGDPTRAAVVHRASEGLPLFVEELLLCGEGAPSASARIEAVLDAHLARVEGDARAVLERAAVAGRSFALDDVAGDAEGRDAARRALGPAVAARLIEAQGEDRYRFAHALLRDRLYGALDPSTRAAWHDRLGAAREASGDLTPAFHHRLAGSRAEGPEALARLALAAARRELAAHGVESAATIAERGLALALGDARLRLELSLLLAEAAVARGALTEGRAAAERAHALAAELGDADAMARAALVYGREIVTGVAQPRLAELLRQAIDAGPSAGLRPPLLARLAAAWVPPRSVEVAEEATRLAWAALAQARASSDAPHRLLTLRHATAALGYMVPRAVQLTLGEETLEVALALERHDVVAEIAGWIHAARREAGMPDAAQALALVEPAVAHLGRHQRWRASAARASQALYDGDLGAARAAADALAEAVTEGSPGATVAHVCLELGLATFAGDGNAPRLRVDAGAAHTLFRPWLAACRGEAGAASAVRALVESPGGFPQHVVAGAAALQLGDVEVARAVRPVLAAHVGENETFLGPGGVFCAGPTTWLVAELDHRLGDLDAARAGWTRALGLARTWAFAPLVARIEARLGAPAAPARSGLPLRMRRAGELWQLLRGDAAIGHLPVVKGTEYLARLLETPGRDIHVLELEGATHREGDAGRLLDPKAVAAYRARIGDLRAELEEAESFGDLGRREAAQAELDALTAELARALGLGGRGRVAGSKAERARVNVQRRLKDAIRRVARVDPHAGAHLERAVRTGTTCVYRP